MNRNSFLNACLSAGAFLAAPFTLLAEIKKGRVDKGIRVLAGKDRFDKPQSLMEGDVFYTKVSSKDTNGDIYIFESTRDRMGGPHHKFRQNNGFEVVGPALTIDKSLPQK